MIVTDPLVLAGVRVTFVDIHVTFRATPAGLTLTLEALGMALAGAMGAGAVGAVVLLGAAEWRREPGWAVTVESILAVLADTTVLTWAGGTLVYICLTAPPCGPQRAHALVPVHQVLTATSILAWQGQAVIHVHCARLARISRITDAGEGCNTIHTVPMVARCVQAVVNVFLAKVPAKAFRTVAGECVHPVNAPPSVQAGGAGALINVILTQ